MSQTDSGGLVFGRGSAIPATYGAGATPNGEPIVTSFPDLNMGHRIPITDTDGRLSDSHMPVRLDEERIIPDIELSILFENALT